MERIEATDIARLRKCIEDTVGYTAKTPKDFERLSEDIFNNTGTILSVSTLMRIWSYVKSDVVPRVHTLNTMVRFVGFKDWNDFCHSNTGLRQSNPIVSKHIKLPDDLCRGQLLRLRWAPDRICDVRYLGDQLFRVEHSVNTRLLKDTQFNCDLIIEGEPLYINLVQQHARQPSLYVCGKKSGIFFSFIDN